MTHATRLSLLLFALAALPGACAQMPAPESPARTVERFLAAYNAHDVDAMLEEVHPDVQWLSVHGESVSVEAAGADELRKSMSEYFTAVPSSRSTIDALMDAGRFVSVWERAHWEAEDGARTQSSLAVYEVEDGKIRRVWYYPTQQ